MLMPEKPMIHSEPNQDTRSNVGISTAIVVGLIIIGVGITGPA